MSKYNYIRQDHANHFSRTKEWSSKIYRWYLNLHAFDPDRHQAEGTEHLQAYPVGRKEIEEKVSSISASLSYTEELYHLRMHIDMLRRLLEQMIGSYHHAF